MDECTIGQLQREAAKKLESTEQSEKYLDVDLEGQIGTAEAVATLLQSVAEALHDAPDGYRYDVSLVLRERQTDEHGDAR